MVLYVNMASRFVPTPERAEVKEKEREKISLSLQCLFEFSISTVSPSIFSFLENDKAKSNQVTIKYYSLYVFVKNIVSQFLVQISCVRCDLTISLFKKLSVY